jgi:hypothetical protein
MRSGVRAAARGHAVGQTVHLECALRHVTAPLREMPEHTPGNPLVALARPSATDTADASTVPFSMRKEVSSGGALDPADRGWRSCSLSVEHDSRGAEHSLPPLCSDDGHQVPRAPAEIDPEFA